MIKITDGRGFQITFANGWTVSVQFGRGNYCENRSYESFGAPEKGMSKDAEIAAWDASNAWYDFGRDTVKGWCSMDEVAAFVYMIANKK